MDQFSQKALILSDFNYSSNLFLHLAVDEYNLGNYSNTVDIIEKGLKDTFQNPAAFIILGKAYARLGKTKLAMQHLKTAAEATNSNRTNDFYLREIENLIKQHQISSNLEILKDSDFKISTTFHQNQNIVNEEIKTSEAIFATETLAKIYISQGEFNEAILVYKKLISIKPENKENYLQRIEELKTRLEK